MSLVSNLQDDAGGNSRDGVLCVITLSISSVLHKTHKLDNITCICTLQHFPSCTVHLYSNSYQ